MAVRQPAVNNRAITRLYFELGRYDAFHRSHWERQLRRWQAAGSGVVKLVASPDDADAILETGLSTAFNDGRVFTLPPESHARIRPEDTFVWDGHDQPSGLLPGLYCSLGTRLHVRGRHRSFSYPYRYNEHIALADFSDARFLYGFSGSLTSGLRVRLFATATASGDGNRTLFRRTDNIWANIFTDETKDAKLRYFDDLRACRFVLCPRGNGLSSVRLFETMEAGRVPVVLSDDLVLPECVDWSRCALRIAEHDLHRLPGLIEAAAPRWEEMARQARREWEMNFSDSIILERIAGELAAILASRGHPEAGASWRRTARIAPAYVKYHLKAGVRAAQKTLQKMRLAA